MNQKGSANIPLLILVLVLAGIAGYFVLKQQPQNLPPHQPAGSTQISPCDQFMGSSLQNKTAERVLSDCDNQTFVVLNHEYAKDKNVVYFRPMPNANFMTVILEGADAKTFELLERCPEIATDKNHVYQSGMIIKDKDPKMLKGGYIENNPQTYCY